MAFASEVHAPCKLLNHLRATFIVGRPAERIATELIHLVWNFHHGPQNLTSIVTCGPHQLQGTEVSRPLRRRHATPELPAGLKNISKPRCRPHHSLLPFSPLLVILRLTVLDELSRSRSFASINTPPLRCGRTRAAVLLRTCIAHSALFRTNSLQSKHWRS